eukprot:2098886-Pyramimonas_sp.AAC.1
MAQPGHSLPRLHKRLRVRQWSTFEVQSNELAPPPARPLQPSLRRAVLAPATCESRRSAPPAGRAT